MLGRKLIISFSSPKIKQEYMETTLLPASTFDASQSDIKLIQVDVKDFNATQLQIKIEKLCKQNKKKDVGVSVADGKNKIVELLNEYMVLLNSCSSSLHVYREKTGNGESMGFKPISYFEIEPLPISNLKISLKFKYSYTLPKNGDALAHSEEKDYVEFNIWKIWTNSPKKRIVKDIIFDPSKPPFLFQRLFKNKLGVVTSTWHFNTFSNYYMEKASSFTEYFPGSNYLSSGAPREKIVNYNNLEDSTEENLKLFKNFLIRDFCRGLKFHHHIPKFLIDKWMESTGFMLIMIHVKRIMSRNEDILFVYLMNCFAHIVQYPDRKLNKSVFFTGAQGAGKSVFFQEFFCKNILGDNLSLVIDNMLVLFAQFNNLLYHKNIIFVDEAGVDPNKVTVSFMNMFKSMVTSNTISVEMKNKNRILQQNFLSLFGGSNCNYPIPLDGDDNRRAFIINVSDEFYNNKDYFNNLVTIMNQFEVCDMFYTFLRFIDLTNFDPTVSPFTQELNLAQNAVKTDIQLWVNDSIEKKVLLPYPFSEDPLDFDPDNKEWQINILYPVQLYQSFLRFHHNLYSHLPNKSKKKPVDEKNFIQEIKNSFLGVQYFHKDPNMPINMTLTVSPYKRVVENFRRTIGKDFVPMRHHEPIKFLKSDTTGLIVGNFYLYGLTQSRVFDTSLDEEIDPLYLDKRATHPLPGDLFMSAMYATIKRLYACPSCKLPMTYPCLLPCGHSLCQRCIPTTVEHITCLKHNLNEEQTFKVSEIPVVYNKDLDNIILALQGVANRRHLLDEHVITRHPIIEKIGSSFHNQNAYSFSSARKAHKEHVEIYLGSKEAYMDTMRGEKRKQVLKDYESEAEERQKRIRVELEEDERRHTVYLEEEPAKDNGKEEEVEEEESNSSSSSSSYQP